MPPHTRSAIACAAARLRVAIAGPVALALLPSVVLLGFWIGGERMLLVLALGLPVCMLLANLRSEAAPQPKKRAYAATREGLLQDLESGRLQNGKIRLVDPARCRMWNRHNRIYGLLNAQNCARRAVSMSKTPATSIPSMTCKDRM